MASIPSGEEAHPLSEFQDQAAAFDNHAAVLDDIRIAEEQVARGEGLENADAKRQVLARFRL